MTQPTPPQVVYSKSGLPTRVRVWEVGPRDGLQNEATSLPTEVKVEFIDRLSACGLPVIEATSFVRPDRVPQLADGQLVMQQISRHPEVDYPVLVPNLRGLAAALEAGARTIAVFASATESFAQRNLGSDLKGQIQMMAPVIKEARHCDVAVRGYVSMCFHDPWEGKVEPEQVLNVCTWLLDSGCQEISLGDTVGVATPGHVEFLLQRLDGAGIPPHFLAVHFHDTYGQALANTLAALEFGISTVDASTGGLGGCPFASGASGNLATEDLVWMLDGLGIETGIDLLGLVQTSAWMARHIGRTPDSRVARALSAKVAGDQ